MGRRALGLGEAGVVTVVPYHRDGHGKWKRAADARSAQSWWAIWNQRGQDGIRRQMVRRGRTKVEARNIAEDEIEQLATGGLLRASDSFLDYGEAWLLQGRENAAQGQRSTFQTYTYAWDRVRRSSLKGLSIEQAAHPQRLTGCLQSIADTKGPGAMKSTRTVLSKVFQRAIADGILYVNPVRNLGEIKTRPTVVGQERDHHRACTREERDALLAHAYAQVPAEGDARTIRKAWAVADLLSICFGIATRIDEARHMRWEDVDLDTNKLFVHGTKNKTSDRLVAAPGWLLERLAARALRSGRDGYVVPSPGLLDPEQEWNRGNSASALRVELDLAGLTWAVPHTGRRTVASLLEKAGVPLSDIADFLGHSDQTTTQRYYIGRDLGGDKTRLAELL